MTRDELQARWYSSHAAGAPDWSVYDDDGYLDELNACWTGYSSRYLKLLEGVAPFIVVGSIVDLGCQTRSLNALQALWPDAYVWGTNVGRQAALVQGYDVAPEPNGHADLVFASEYLEHHERPIEHWSGILDATTPNWVAIASTFSQPAIGHFPFYLDGDRTLTGRRVSRAFGDLMRARGYRRGPWRFWNDRPAIWIRA